MNGAGPRWSWRENNSRMTGMAGERDMKRHPAIPRWEAAAVGRIPLEEGGAAGIPQGVSREAAGMSSVEGWRPSWRSGG
jgi:hypothetical protein